MKNGIDLYCTDITQWEISSFKNCLTSEEWDNLNAITHRPTFCQKGVSRLFLRNLLQSKYSIERENLVIEQNDRGKPFLKSHPSLCFNNSHSKEKVLIGITRDHMIGVDIEFIDPLPDEEGVAKHFFSPREFAQYKDYKCDNEKAFFMFWTAKEAVIKALGRGLWEADQVPDISIEKSGFFLYSNSKILTDWTLEFLNVDEHYVACVAVNCPQSTKKIHLCNIQNQIY